MATKCTTINAQGAHYCDITNM